MSEADRQRWDARHAERGVPGEPSASVVALAEWMPAAGSALDLAGGAGWHALWLARRGLAVTLADISPVALAIARVHSGDLPVTTVALDLDDGELPPGPWDLILVAHFVDRRVYGMLPSLLAPGGTLVVVHPTIINLERNPSPAAPFLLEPGELASFARGLEVLVSDEGWTTEGRHEARLVARRPHL
jgi:tellurite methyltransferase